MDKAKLIEKLKAERRLLERPDVETMVWLSGAEVEFILTSLTAPVPDGKEEMIPFKFVQWYSGMEEKKIRNAYDKYKLIKDGKI